MKINEQNGSLEIRDYSRLATISLLSSDLLDEGIRLRNENNRDEAVSCFALAYGLNVIQKCDDLKKLFDEFFRQEGLSESEIERWHGWGYMKASYLMQIYDIAESLREQGKKPTFVLHKNHSPN